MYSPDLPNQSLNPIYKNKFFLPLLVLIIIISLIFLGIKVFLTRTNLPTLNWQKYSNQYFSIRIPPNWELLAGSKGEESTKSANLTTIRFGDSKNQTLSIFIRKSSISDSTLFKVGRVSLKTKTSFPLNGVPSIRFDYQKDNNSYSDIVTQKTPPFIWIRYVRHIANQDRTLLNQILATMKLK